MLTWRLSKTETDGIDLFWSGEGDFTFPAAPHIDLRLMGRMIPTRNGTGTWFVEICGRPGYLDTTAGTIGHAIRLVTDYMQGEHPDTEPVWLAFLNITQSQDTNLEFGITSALVADLVTVWEFTHITTGSKVYFDANGWRWAWSNVPRPGLYRRVRGESKYGQYCAVQDARRADDNGAE